MKNFKKLLAVLLASLMLLSLVACGAKDENVFKIAMIEGSGLEAISTPEHEEHMKNDNDQYADVTVERINYDNLSSALMDLESGKINAIGIEGCVANYMAAHNDKVTVVKSNRTTDFSMMTMENNKEVFDILNNAIKAMKEDGTLATLVENELKAYINSDPTPKELPHFDGAMTIKVGVTGDLPPMDFVASNGKAAGFNIALLTEIANRAQVNIELVQIESGARAIALSSGNVDAVFWTKSATCTVCGATGAEEINGTLVTESYFTDNSATVTLKSEK
jgi:polar amino acid transport system substrate-binding protein